MEDLEVTEGPYWTVVLPTRDRTSLLSRAMGSVLRQHDDDWELIVVDDGSEEDISRVVSDLGDSRVSYARTEGVGAASARNVGVVMGRGRWVTFLDSDDEALPDWLSAIRAEAESSGADIVSVGYLDRTQEPPLVALPADQGPLFPGIVGLFTKAGSYALERSVFQTIGGFAPDLAAGQHTELSLRLLDRADAEGWTATHVDRPLVVIHDHDGARIRRDPEALRAGALYMLEHHHRILSRSRRRLADSHAIAGVNSSRCGDRRAGRRHLLEAVRTYPFKARNWLRLGRVFTPW
ncbi:MAG: glycosyltransferase family A protein [Nitriliruptorales bacterium]|nr:glycosyltransferase family A protein [Nitriliruptorales bacterium]